MVKSAPSTERSLVTSTGAAPLPMRLYTLLMISILVIGATLFYSWYDGKRLTETHDQGLEAGLLILRYLHLDPIDMLADADMTGYPGNLPEAMQALNGLERALTAEQAMQCGILVQSTRQGLEKLGEKMPDDMNLWAIRDFGLIAVQSRVIDLQQCLQGVRSAESKQRFNLHLGLVGLATLLLMIMLTLFFRFERRLSETAMDLRRLQQQSQARAENLARSEANMRALVEASQDAIFIENQQGQILDCNDRACRLHGYTREEMLKLTVADLVPKQIADELQAQAEVEWPVGGVHIAGIGQRKDGVLFPTEVSIVPAPAADEDRIFVYSRDVSDRERLHAERQQLEGRLRHQQKLESIGTLASGVAHEINNPVNIILNYAELIDSKAADADKVREFAAQINHESERIATIVKDLLAFSRHEKESHSPARVEDIVKRTLSITRKVLEKDQVLIEVDLADELPQIKCRSQQIQQVFMNLLTNARDALNERYPGYAEDKKVIVTARAFMREDEQWVRISVEDHGPGIAPQVVERIFDPFFTTKSREKGTGLGLSVSHGIIKEHRGELTVESEPGEFTRFNIELRVNNGWQLGQE